MESSKNKEGGSEFSQEQFSAIYPPGIENHYWNLARNMIVRDVLMGLSPAPAGILDVGAGAGVVTAYLKDHASLIWGVEPAPVPIPIGLEGILFSGTKMRDVDMGIRSRVDTALLLDVIEHLQDPQKLIEETQECLPNLKYMIVTVPARQEIWSNYDEFNGHHLRYDRPRLIKLMDELGWQPAYCGYCFHALYWPALLLSGLGLKRSTAISAPKGRKIRLHAFLARFLYWEFKLGSRSLVGSSIIAAFIRKAVVKNNQ